MALLTARLAILGQLDAIVPALEDLLAPDDGRRLAIGPQGGQVRLDRRERGATAGFQHDRRRTVRPVLDERIVAEAAEILRTHERVRRQRCVGDVRRFAREVEPEQLDRSATDDVIAERHLAVGMDRRAEAGATIAVLISAVAAARRGAARRESCCMIPLGESRRPVSTRGGGGPSSTRASNHADMGTTRVGQSRPRASAAVHADTCCRFGGAL